MTDRTLTAAEHPRALSPLVEAVRLENAIKRKRRQVEKLATKLQDAEFERQVFEAALERVRKPLVSVEASGAHLAAADAGPPGPPRGGSLCPDCGAPIGLCRDTCARQAEGGEHAPRQVTPGADSPSRTGETTKDDVRGVDDPERGETVPRSGGAGWQPTASSAPASPAASAEQLAPSGTAGFDSGGSGAATSTGIRSAPEVGSTPEPAGSSKGGDAHAAGAPRGEPRPPEVAPRADLTSAKRGLEHAHARPGAGFHRGGSAWGKQAKDETGNRYGKLVVIERAPNEGLQVRWRCGCDCGGQIVAWGVLLRKGRVTSCHSCTPKNTPTCSRCGEPGHNVRSCAAMPARAEPAALAGKRCIQCGVTKPLSDFYAHPSGKGQSRCKVCDNNTRVKRSGGTPGAPPGPRPKRFICFKCGSMPHRVEGVRCSGCGLERREEKVRATDFAGGDSALSRAIG